MKFYIIQKGDTICSIAEKFKTTKENIVNLNQLTNSDYIKEGEIIRVK